MTIKDIAKESGYAVGTVSRVLNNHPDVSEKARKTIMEVVEKHHFKLNNNAKHLKQQASSGIAIIVKGSQNMLFASIVERLQGLIEEKDFACFIYYIGEEENEVEQAESVCLERHPKGILFLGSNLKFFQERFARIDVPCVLVTNSAEQLHFRSAFAAVIAAAFHGRGQLVGPAESADEQRHQNGNQGLHPLHEAAVFKIRTTGPLSGHDLIRFFD